MILPSCNRQLMLISLLSPAYSKRISRMFDMNLSSFSSTIFSLSQFFFQDSLNNDPPGCHGWMNWKGKKKTQQQQQRMFNKGSSEQPFFFSLAHEATAHKAARGAISRIWEKQNARSCVTFYPEVHLIIISPRFTDSLVLLVWINFF